MRSIAVITALASLNAFASATQVQGGFSLNLERRSRSANSLARRANGQGSAEVEAIYNGSDWVTSMKVGGQVLRAQIDTGSSDLWFISTLADAATTKQFQGTNTFYDPSKSSTWTQQEGLIFNSTYDVGEFGAIGVAGTETVELGGVSVTSMLIGAATSIFGTGALDTVYDGTMGLGWGRVQSSIVDQTGQSVGAPSFMQAVQNSLALPVFTLDFRPNVPETINFGFINSQIYTGNLVKQAIDNTTTYWGVDGITFSAGGKTLGGGASNTVIFDSGGLETTVTQQIASDYWSQVSGSAVKGGYWTFPCGTKSFPDLTFRFSTGDTAVIPGTLLNSEAATRDGVTCRGGLQVSSNGVLNAGNGFFEAYFTVFNQAEPSISFAPYSTSYTDNSNVENEANLPTATDAAALTPGKNAAAKTVGNSMLALVVAVVMGSML